VCIELENGVDVPEDRDAVGQGVRELLPVRPNDHRQFEQGGSDECEVECQAREAPEQNWRQEGEEENDRQEDVIQAEGDERGGDQSCQQAAAEQE